MAQKLAHVVPVVAGSDANHDAVSVQTATAILKSICFNRIFKTSCVRMCVRDELVSMAYSSALGIGPGSTVTLTRIDHENAEFARIQTCKHEFMETSGEEDLDRMLATLVLYKLGKRTLDSKHVQDD